jgi:hypothetical protein
MKARTLVVLFVGFMIVGISTITVTGIKRTEKQLLTPKNHLQIKEKYFSLLLPDYLKEGKRTNHNGWEIRNFYLTGAATFRLAKYNSKNSNFEQLVKNYFGIKDFSKNSDIYKLPKGIGYYKKIPIVENGIYVMEKYKKSVKYIYFFTLNEQLYWLDFYPESTLVSYKTIFDNILASIKFTDGKGVNKLFKGQLKTVCFDSYLLFCQPYEALIVLPILIIIFVWVFVSIINKKMGEKPSDTVLAELNPQYVEQNVEMATKVKNKISFWGGFIAISSRYFVIYRFKKELVRMPLGDVNIQAKEKTGFFGKKYVEISLPNNKFYKKKNFYYNRPHKIRIYSDNVSAIVAYF